MLCGLPTPCDYPCARDPRSLLAFISSYVIYAGGESRVSYFFENKETIQVFQAATFTFTKTFFVFIKS